MWNEHLKSSYKKKKPEYKKQNQKNKKKKSLLNVVFLYVVADVLMSLKV